MAGPFLARVFRVKSGCSCYGRTDAADGWYFAPARVGDENLGDGFEGVGPFETDDRATVEAVLEMRAHNARLDAEEAR